MEELGTKKSKVLVKAVGDVPSRPMTKEERKKLGYKLPILLNEEDAVKLGLIIREYNEVTSRSNIDINKKQFTDSLYYSFARLFDKKANQELDTSFAESRVLPTSESLNKVIVDVAEEDGEVVGIPDTLGDIDVTDNFQIKNDEVFTCPIPKGINPARIKTIWSKKYNNTILATKEFEERLKVIHETHDDALLNIYVNNIDKPLWHSDSVASTLAGYQSKFEAFYQEKKGGVRVNDNLAKNLASYYEKKQKAYTTKSSELFRAYEEQKQKLKQDFLNKKGEKNIEEFNRKNKALLEEFDMNMENACAQLGKECNQRSGNITVSLGSLGPKNLDAYVMEATVNRTTLDYTDPETGKKAVIKYEEASVKITNQETFDRVFVYMVPDSLSSFTRMKSKDNINFKNTLNDLLNYELVCLAYKGEQAYFYKGNLQPQHYDVALKPITDAELQATLNKQVEGGKSNDIRSDINFYKEEIKYNKAKAKFKEKDELTLKIGTFLFPMLDDNCILQSRNRNTNNGLDGPF